MTPKRKVDLGMTLAIVTVLAMVAAAAWAQVDDQPYWSEGYTAMADACATDGTPCLLIPAPPKAYPNSNRYTSLMTTSGESVCVLAASVTSVTVDADGTVGGGGSFGTGQGAAIRLMQTGDIAYIAPDAMALARRKTPGAGDGYCPNRAPKSGGDDNLHATCRVSAGTTDCTSFGGGTCVALTSAGALIQSRLAVIVVCDGNVQVSKWSSRL